MWKNYDWLNAGGAEIVLEVVRRLGWSVEVESAEKWDLQSDIVAVGDRNENTVWVNGESSPWLQAVATVAIARSRFKLSVPYGDIEYSMPFFHAGELLDENEVHDIDRFIDMARYSSEATISLMVSADGAT